MVELFSRPNMSSAYFSTYNKKRTFGEKLKTAAKNILTIKPPRLTPFGRAHPKISQFLLSAGPQLLPVGGAGRAISAVGKASRAIGGYLRGPASTGAFLSRFPRALGAATLAGVGFAVPYFTAKSDAPAPIKAAAVAGGATLSPFGIAGSVYGTGKFGVRKAEELMSRFGQSPDFFKHPVTFGVPRPTETSFMRDYQKYLASLAGAVPSMPSMSLSTSPIEIGAPSYAAPSINVGGGPDITPILLALLAGGGAGYLVGRKRKKYKRRKRRK